MNNPKTNMPSKALAEVELDILKENQKKIKNLLDEFKLYPHLII